MCVGQLNMDSSHTRIKLSSQNKNWTFHIPCNETIRNILSVAQSDGLGKYVGTNASVRYLEDRESLKKLLVFAASKGYLLVLFTVQLGKSILEAFSDNLSRPFMVLMESCHRLLDFLKRSNVVSPTVALETATALQHKIEKATR
ncbi:hypothetical protein OROHE_021863 [Orobanche hederae]